MLIAIPSRGRAGKTPTLRVLPDAVLYVPDNEVDDYRRLASRATVVGVPSDRRGITATRNYILETSRERWVVMVDDDVRSQGYREMSGVHARHRRMTEREWLTVWERLFELTESLAYRLWGVATTGAARAVYPWRPFLWHSYVTGSCMGIINDPQRLVRFDESYPVKEDYELCLRMMRVAGRYTDHRSRVRQDRTGRAG